MFRASPVARRHANALSTKAAQIRMVLRHHGRNFAKRSARTLEAILSHDTANHPAHLRHAAFGVWTNMFRAPKWHGATQTRFPPRPRKSAWYCDIRDVIRHTVCPHTTSNPITRYRQSSRSPATRRVYTSMFCAPQWHSATQHSPPRKSAWHCDITNVIRRAVCPHTRSNHITRYRQSSHSPATRRVYTSVFRAPQWNGATHTHFPPRPRKSAWHCDITDVICHTVCATLSHDTANHPAHQRHAAFTPACFALPSLDVLGVC